ncbi:MAG TPA: haloacid dehalogenase type II [Thermomicrobiaceae bacterium]|nr:haloacid dehalogenase type II [Thermomicrobiaceae bacterium]
MVGTNDIRIVTFDCYGTLVDSAGGSGAFLYDLALRQRDPDPPPGWTLRDRLEAIQFELIQGAYLSYREVLAQSLRRYFAERNYTWDQREADAYVRSMGCWQPFPDTRAALQRVHDAGLRLAIISNTDRDIMAHTLRQLALPFEAAITAEECHAYKPDPAVFDHALSRLGQGPAHVLHVAFGYKYDIATAQRLGLHTAWVNRRGESVPGATRPDFTWRDLWGLADFAEDVAGQR